MAASAAGGGIVAASGAGGGMVAAIAGSRRGGSAAGAYRARARRVRLARHQPAEGSASRPSRHRSPLETAPPQVPQKRCEPSTGPPQCGHIILFTGDSLWIRGVSLWA